MNSTQPRIIMQEQIMTAYLAGVAVEEIMRIFDLTARELTVILLTY